MIESIEIDSKYNDHAVDVKYVGADYLALTIKNLRNHESTSQFAYISKDSLLDVLAQIGWLPEEYRKPEPSDPREAKIREVATALYNSDNEETLTVGAYGRHLTKYDLLWEDSCDYESAKALIEAGLVVID